MRWEGSRHGSLGVAASACTFASRDEDPNLYYYYASTKSASTCASVAGPVKVQPQDSRGLYAKKPPEKHVSKRVSSGGSSGESRFPGANRVLNPHRLALSTAATEGGKSSAATPEHMTMASARRSALIMCAGKSVYGPGGSDSDGSSSSNNSLEPRIGASSVRSLELWLLANGGAETSSDSRHPSSSSAGAPDAVLRRKRGGDLGHSSPHRPTDEELEQIIRDLRGQIFQQQPQRVEPLKRLPSRKNDEQRSGAREAETQQPHHTRHHRKHLKNPVEKMQGVVSSVPVAEPTGGTSTPRGDSALLLRPLSGSHLCRFTMENATQMVVPAVINRAIPTSARSRRGQNAASSSNSNNGEEVQTARAASFAQPTASSTARNNSSNHAAEQPEHRPTRLSEGAILNARQTRGKPPTSARLRREREKEREKARGRDNERWEDARTTSDGFLYLVDVEEDGADAPELLSLSPVGPWVVHGASGAVAGVGTATPRSPCSFTCRSRFSFGDDGDENEEEHEQRSRLQLAAMSPRSRLLYFSAPASFSTRTSLHPRAPLRRSATCGSGLTSDRRPTDAAGRHDARATTRCSSAKASCRANSRPSGGGRGKAAGKSQLAKKRPHSGGTTTSRSFQSESSGRNE